ncbi:PHD finger protein ING1 [Camellia lanceoleosa]|uniref:PHD finger protein ING1 n=1 Tax=Camellia lanceoleosa TaxID=1840588 RepID=A0ACC0GJX9_9ERIC|nr:PHD finger protein ING1 [Camellia lanceoleosa]
MESIFNRFEEKILTDTMESLLNMLQKKYALLHNLDKSLQDIQQQNEQHCEQEIEEIKKRIKSGNITLDVSNIRFSDEILDEQKHATRIANENVTFSILEEMQSFKASVEHILYIYYSCG